MVLAAELRHPTMRPPFMQPISVLLSGLALALAATAQDPAPPPPGKQEQPVNRLAKETSPYLRQHQHNPVDWYPWGEEALKKAKADQKPIFLSIGYSACHWCHVMEHESFEDAATAKLMNEHFVCIKVDREERPDLDEIYMAAVQAMTGQGGWPMSVWLTPELQPFYGGTYFPPEDMHGRPGFKRVLQALADTWKDRREDLVKASGELTGHLKEALAPRTEPGEVTAKVVSTLVQQSARHYDSVYAGFANPPGYAPKFPHASELGVLLRAAAAGDKDCLPVAIATLDRMQEGGMYDQLGFGFHRYSTDREWLVPHFEKMLYDNGLLVPVYLEATLLTGEGRHAEIARQCLDYLVREMQDPRGGFWSSQDADSEGVEGRFFVWSRDEVRRLCGDDAAVAILRWGITESGNWEHSNVLSKVRPVADVAKESKRSEAEVEQALERARQKLLASRSKRVHPGTDDKVLVAWNGMAIGALARGYQLLGDKRWLQAAQKAAAFVLEEMVSKGRCRRSWHSGKSQHQGYLEDHAFLCDALLTLFESDFDPRWLEAARELLQTMQQHFRDPADGNFWFTADDHEELLARTKSVSEASTPSGTAMAALSFLRAGLLLGDEELYGIGTAALRANAALLERMPLACPSLVLALQFHLADPREVVIAGEPGDPRTQALLAAVRRQFPPHRVMALVHDGNRKALAALSPVFRDKEPVRSVPAAYVCRRGVCEAPVTDPAKLVSK
jgi:uncharacterized protein YyaL (SSP411 family)